MEVFLAFLGLGLTAFGGPLAHLAYFQRGLVAGRGWVTPEAFSGLVALAQALPGPTSSQVALALGFARAGLPGALAAWLGFTLPSALLLFLAGLGLQAFAPPPGLLQGLKLLAVAVVAHAAGEMARALAPAGKPFLIALISAVLLALWPGWQVPVLALGGFLGLALLPPGRESPGALPQTPSSRLAGKALFLFIGLGLGLLLLGPAGPLPTFLLALYLSGSLIFGGGHVVLPLLEARLVPDLMEREVFLAGYGLAQAVPGPLFSFAAFLGTQAPLGLPAPLAALLALLGLFLPGSLLLLAALPFWQALGENLLLRRALAGVNAAVVGLLLAALYDPLFLQGVQGREDFALALLLYGALRLGAPLWTLALSGATLGTLFL